jgi:hypothetical protein
MKPSASGAWPPEAEISGPVEGSPTTVRDMQHMVRGLRVNVVHLIAVAALALTLAAMVLASDYTPPPHGLYGPLPGVKLMPVTIPARPAPAPSHHPSR